MSAVWWFVLGIGAGWMVLAVPAAVWLGRMLKARDAQKPVEPQLVLGVKPQQLDPKLLVALAESIRTNPPSGPRRDKQ